MPVTRLSAGATVTGEGRVCALAGRSGISANGGAGQEMSMNRQVIPNQSRAPRGAAGSDIRDVGDVPFPKQVRAPKDAPNVLVIMIDDMGFAASSAFGGPCEMPTAERLAAGGLRYSRFHTTALCSPTRAALLTGRNHHSVGMGTLTDLSSGYPGYTTVRPDSAANIAEVLRLNGYSTAAFGKWHQTPSWEVGPTGPFDRWAIGEGFERFYGFMGGETDQWNPTLFEGVRAVPTPNSEDYHLSEDLADQAIAHVRELAGLAPDKPWFTYLAFGATHAPHHAPAEYVERYRGRFDDGWDAVREATLERQKAAGIVPADCQLSARPDEIPAWDGLGEDERRLFARMMETYAAAATHTDDQVGRIVDELQRLEILDDTLIIYILGDNGASAEGGVAGTLNEFAQYNNVPETVETMLPRIDEIGGPTLFNHYTAGWAHAMDTPYQWTKQVASHWGGTRNGMVTHWPKGFEARGEVRDQFTHVTSVVPTILEAAGLPLPEVVDGVAQMAYPNPAFGYTFDDASAPEQHTTQYFETMGNRGIYHEGWSACAIHSVPWDLVGEHPPFDDDVWELYAPDDHSQAHDVAAEHPQRLAKMKELFLIEAARFDVLPLDDRKAAKLDPQLVGRPDPMSGRTRMVLYPGAMHLGEASVLNVKNRDHTVTASITVGDEPAEGAIIVQGGRFGGWTLYLDQGRLTYGYNWVDHARYFVRSDQVLSAGDHDVQMVFSYDGGGVGKGATVTLLVDGEEVGSGRIDNTCGYLFGTTEAMDVGRDSAAPVVEEYRTPRGECTATIGAVIIDTAPAADHDGEGMVRALLQRQ